MNANYLRRWFYRFRHRTDRRPANYQWLAAIAAEIGQGYEQKSYDELQVADEAFGQLSREDRAIGYTVNVFDRLDNGDLGVCIDIHSDLPTPWGILPAYQFYKRPDGSVYYGE
jgi:hypothetical protein